MDEVGLDVIARGGLCPEAISRIQVGDYFAAPAMTRCHNEVDNDDSWTGASR